MCRRKRKKGTCFTFNYITHIRTSACVTMKTLPDPLEVTCKNADEDEQMNPLLFMEIVGSLLLLDLRRWH
jgi:hypothetical protein